MFRKVNSLLIITAMAFFACPLHADIANPTEYYDGGVSASLEGILSLEYPFSAKTSLLVWVGGALVQSLSHHHRESLNPTYGIEGSLEFRFYPAGDNRTKLFVGLYAGIGYVKGPWPYNAFHYDYEYETFTIQSFGAKIGYKIIAINRNFDSSSLRLAFEPYMSGSLAYYYSSIYGEGEYFVWNAPWLTFGLRVVFEYHL